MVKRGQIVFVNLDPVVGSEQGKMRPALIVQNDVGNKFSPITIIAPITSRLFSKEYPCNVEIDFAKLKKKGTILTSQIRAIDKARIVSKVGVLGDYTMRKVDKALKISLGLWT